MNNSSQALNDRNYVNRSRVFGIFLIVCSIIELGIGGAVFSYLQNVSSGSWWCAMFTLVLGICALFPSNKKVVIGGAIFSVISSVVCVVGASLDQHNYKIFSSLLGCYNSGTQTYTGAANGENIAKVCASEYGGQCACTNNQLCYSFDLVSGNNCSGILTTYTPNLCASAVFGYVLFACSIGYWRMSSTRLGICTSNTANNYTYNPAASVNSEAIQEVSVTIEVIPAAKVSYVTTDISTQTDDDAV